MGNANAFANERIWRQQVIADIAAVSGGGVPVARLISTGTGLSGGGDLSADRTLSIANTIVAGGPTGDSSHSPQITYNAQGQLTAVSSVAITPAAIGAAPTSRLISTGTGLSGGGDLSADRTLSIANTIVAGGPTGDASHVAQVTYNAQGQLTTVSSVAITPSAIGAAPTSRLVSSGTGLSGGGDLSADRTLSIANTIVAGGPTGDASHSPQITYNAQGQLTAVASVAITPTAIGAVPTSRLVSSGTGLSGGGDLSADRTLSIANTIVAGGPTGDSSHVAQITYNAQGQLTAVSSVAITASAVGAVPTARLISSGTGLSGGGDLSADRTLSIANTIVAGGPTGDASHVAQITYNAQGQLTAVSSVAVTPSAIGAVATSRLISTGTGLSGGGDLSADRTLVLANTAVAAGTYGNSTNVASFTVDAQGRLTAASNVGISSSPLGLADGGKKTADFTAAVNSKYRVSTVSGNVTATLPTGTAGDIILLIKMNAANAMQMCGTVNAAATTIAISAQQSLLVSWSSTVGWV